MAETGVHRDVALMLLNRKLMASMEKSVYEQFVDDVQTRVDTDAPAEMRWLVVFARAGSPELGRLRERYAAATNLMPWLVRWLTTSLNDALAVTIDMVPPEQPVVITLKSGRLLLRTAMAKPDPVALAQWASVFEHALNEAVLMGGAWRDSLAVGPQTQPCAWSASELTPPSVQPGLATPLPPQVAGNAKPAAVTHAHRRSSTPSS